MISERKSNWCIVTCPNPEWAKLVHPDLAPDEAYERLWKDSSTSFASTSPTPQPPGRSGWPCSTRARASLTERRFDAIHLRGPGHRPHRRPLPSGALAGRRLRDRRRPPPLPEPAHRGGLHDPRPAASRGPRHVDEAARADRRHDHPRPAGALRGRPRGRDRRRRERRRAPQAGSRRRRCDRGSASWRSSIGRAGSARSTRSSTTR